MPRVLTPAASEPSFVIFGIIEGRKNHTLLLSLWHRMLAAGGGNRVPRLVIIDRRGWQAEHAFAERKGVACGNRVSEEGARGTW